MCVENDRWPEWSKSFAGGRLRCPTFLKKYFSDTWDGVRTRARSHKAGNLLEKALSHQMEAGFLHGSK